MIPTARAPRAARAKGGASAPPGGPGWGILRTPRPPFSASNLLVLLLCAEEQGYHLVHATYLDTDCPARGTLPHWGHYHPARTGRDGGRPSGRAGLPPRS